MLLFLVLVVNPPGFKFYVVTRSYSSRPFLCALVIGFNKTLYAPLEFLVRTPTILVAVLTMSTKWVKAIAEESQTCSNYLTPQ